MTRDATPVTYSPLFTAVTCSPHANFHNLEIAVRLVKTLSIILDDERRGLRLKTAFRFRTWFPFPLFRNQQCTVVATAEPTPLLSPEHTFTFFPMELTFLLIGVAITAGVYMILFFLASAMAWMFHRRCKRLQQRINRIDSPHSHTHQHPNMPSTTASQAREERRQRREREEEQQSGTIHLTDLSGPHEAGPSTGAAASRGSVPQASHSVKL